MEQRHDVDRLLATWSEDAYSPPAPAYLSKVLERTQRTRQRHAWASLERWLPMTVTTDRPAAPRALRLAWILLIVVALVVVAAGIAIVGSRVPGADPGAASRRGGRDRVHVSGRRRDRTPGGRPVHRPRRRHGPPSADRCLQHSRHRPVAAVVARWHAHRLPPLPGGDGLGHGDRRRRRQPDDPVDGCRRARRVLLRARRLLVVGGWADRGLRRPRAVPRPTRPVRRPGRWVGGGGDAPASRHERRVSEVLARRPTDRLPGQ